MNLLKFLAFYFRKNVDYRELFFDNLDQQITISKSRGMMKNTIKRKGYSARLKCWLIVSLFLALFCVSGHAFAQSQPSPPPGGPPLPPPPDEVLKKINPFKKHKKDTTANKKSDDKTTTSPSGPAAQPAGPPPPPNPLNLFKKKKKDTTKNGKN